MSDYDEFLSKQDGRPQSLKDIPTACRRCGDIFKEENMVWIERCHNEKWLVCDHCAYVIAYCNRMIDYLREDRI